MPSERHRLRTPAGGESQTPNIEKVIRLALQQVYVQTKCLVLLAVRKHLLAESNTLLAGSKHLLAGILILFPRSKCCLGN